MFDDHDLYVEDPYFEEDLRTVKQHPGQTPEVLLQCQLRQYGLTPADYERLLQEQSGVCAICEGTNKNGRRLAVDHCHETDRIRGLLCGTCNSGIGLLKDDPDLCRLAAKYLEEPQGG